MGEFLAAGYDTRQMKDVVGPRCTQKRTARFDVSEIGRMKRPATREGAIRPPPRDAVDLGTSTAERVDQTGADEAGRTGDQHAGAAKMFCRVRNHSSESSVQVNSVELCTRDGDGSSELARLSYGRAAVLTSWQRFCESRPFRTTAPDSPMTNPRITLHKGDLPAKVSFGSSVAIDTETLGLKPNRDRLCLVQLSAGDNEVHLVQFDGKSWAAPNLRALLADPNILKVFHFGRFDLAILERYLEVGTSPVWCTKIASKLVRTYTDRHGLKDLCAELLGLEMSKQQQSSDWGAPVLTQQQLAYAASDVLHLHKIKARLETMLKRDSRLDLAEAAFRFLPDRARLDLAGFEDMDIFAH